MERKIILASSSPRRKEILSRFIQDFEIIPADIDENFPGLKSCEEEALTVAAKKAETAAKLAPENSFIIAADTIVVADGKIYGKPGTEEKAIEALKELRGRTHEVITAVACVDKITGKRIEFTETTKVTFLRYSDDTIKSYAATGEPLDKAGSYGLQGEGRKLVKSVAGDKENVIGLPAKRLVKELKKAGVFIF